MGYQRQRFLDNAVHVDVRGFGGSRARKIQKIVDDFAGTKCLLDDLLDDRLPRITVRHLLCQHLDVIRNHSQGRIYFMGDSRGEESKRRQLLGLRHLLCHTLALRDIVEEQETPDTLGGLADERSDGNVQSERFALMVQALFVNPGDLLLVPARRNLRCKFFREKGAELPADGFLPGHAEKLLHARIPGFDDAFQIYCQNADIQRFHNVFAEVFEARNFESLLLERGIKLSVIECHGDIAGNGFHQLDVIAGKIVAVDGFSEPQNGDGVFADAAGNIVIEVELFESAANGFANLSSCAGRLKKQRSARKLGPGRSEETEIERLRKTHTHRASQAETSRARNVLDKYGEAVDKERLRDAVHHRAKHRLKPHFVCERAAELDQGAPIVQAVAVEETVETRLNPFAEGLEKQSGDNDGDDAAHGPVGLCMKDLRDQRYKEEINRGDGSRCRGICQAALEDNVHIH